MITLIWTITSTVACLAAGYGILEAMADLRYAQKVTNGEKPMLLLVAYQRLFAQTVRSSVGGAWALLGLSLYLAGYESQLTISSLILLGGNIAWTIVAITDVAVGRKVRM